MYKIIEKNEDPKLSRIEKETTAEFTIYDMEGEQEQARKLISELEAKKTFEEAKMNNVKSYHPYVLDFTEEQLFTISMYFESYNFIKMCDVKLEETKKQLEESIAEKELIQKELDIPEPEKSIPSPFQGRDDEGDDKVIS